MVRLKEMQMHLFFFLQTLRVFSTLYFGDCWVESRTIFFSHFGFKRNCYIFAQYVKDIHYM